MVVATLLFPFSVWQSLGRQFHLLYQAADDPEKCFVYLAAAPAGFTVEYSTPGDSAIVHHV